MADPRNRSARVAAAQYKAATREPHEFLKFYMDEANSATWYISMSNFTGDEDEFAGGEYLVKVELPEKFPHEPPRFYFLTDNGLYKKGDKVCVSIGEYHKDQYRAALGVTGFCNTLVSGLIGWREMGNGINIIKTTPAEKRAIAAASHEYNLANNGEILEKINTAFEGYSRTWDLSKVSEELKNRLGLNSNG